MHHDPQILHSTMEDLDTVLWLFSQAMALKEKDGYRVWDSIDETALQRDIEAGIHYKLIKDDVLIGIFSVQYKDPFIWQERDKGDAIYLHRIVMHPGFKGQKLFQYVLDWAVQLARQQHLKFVRMDTWADNHRLIAYYESFGFEFIENYVTPNAPELPIQNRNLEVALLEMKC